MALAALQKDCMAGTVVRLISQLLSAGVNKILESPALPLAVLVTESQLMRSLVGSKLLHWLQISQFLFGFCCRLVIWREMFAICCRENSALERLLEFGSFLRLLGNLNATAGEEPNVAGSCERCVKNLKLKFRSFWWHREMSSLGLAGEDIPLSKTDNTDMMFLTWASKYLHFQNHILKIHYSNLKIKSKHGKLMKSLNSKLIQIYIYFSMGKKLIILPSVSSRSDNGVKSELQENWPMCKYLFIFVDTGHKHLLLNV